ncbi:MAG: hypothetical protein GX148_02355 [Clostridiales bacterium]|jgi:RNA polymerase subunit RPABC4/transcription elongation factor Spt4|nr:hypothetical protein [Clostridiales bacterium]
MNCPGCNQNIPEDSEFCPDCGFAINTPPEAEEVITETGIETQEIAEELPEEGKEAQNLTEILPPEGEAPAEEVPADETIELVEQPPVDAVQTLPVCKKGRLFALLALFSALVGMLVLALGIYNKIDGISDYAKYRIEVNSPLSALVCFALPVSLIAVMIIDFTFLAKAVSCQKKSGGLQIVTLIFTLFYLALTISYNGGSLLLGNNDISLDLSETAGYLYNTSVIKNYLLISAVFLVASLVFQIIKLLVFRKHKKLLQ